MKIYDCFQFFDEEMLLDLRLNILDRYVDKFVISEAMYKHNGDKKKLNFDINKFRKFKEKIIYLVVDTPPPDLSNINEVILPSTLANVIQISAHEPFVIYIF